MKILSKEAPTESPLRQEAFTPSPRTKIKNYTCLKLEDSRSSICSVEGISEHQRKDSHQLHDNVESRSRGILEWISNSITDDSSLVNVRPLSFEV
mmetsp:Transcript_18685/g.39224  ORF Transcript_18685/g.39224 Transcript_18685/m.39224 type:complete len:95 (-) Transcript_18685:289-573(-)